MAFSLDLRRRWFVGAALLVSASPTLAANPRQAPPKKKAAQAPLTVTEMLMRDQGILQRVLLIYEAGIRRLGQDEDLEPIIFTGAGEVMREFVHGYHEKAKEELVYAQFTKAGRMVGLVDVLRAQHQAGRQLTERIVAAAEPSRTNRGERTAMIEAMKASITLYRPHMARETTDVLPTLRTLITPNEFEEITATLEKREGELFGADGFEKVAKRVEALEKRIGIHDLAQYTPKT